MREAYFDAVRKWIAGDVDTAIFLLRLAIKQTETLISALEKEETRGKG